jgi:ubiquitin-conjugating enzyme E2 O
MPPPVPGTPTSDAPPTSSQATNPRRWAKRIQTEWAALEASLPDSIYLHVYEGRMDLMRAVIVGAAGTPYHDNLFFFDFHFPPEYPNSPPLAQYHSGGLRVNPNLYESGKVCLSLLNTWNGKGTELWDSTSSMLQVGKIGLCSVSSFCCSCQR